MLENLGTRQTIFKNTFWLALAEIVARFLKLILIIFIARILGATEYGKFTFALAFVGLFGFIADFGVSEILTREFSKDKEKEKDFLSLLSLRIFLSLLALVFTIGLSFFITQDLLIRKIIWLLALMIFSHILASLCFSFLRARQKMQYEAWVRIFEAVVVTGLGFLVLFKLPSVLTLSWVYFLAAFLALLAILIFFHKKVLPLSLSFDKTIWKKYLQLSWPLAFVVVFASIYNQIDSVMMGYWGLLTETGWYNAAYKIVDGLIIPGGIIAGVFFPALSFSFQNSKQKFQRIWSFYLQVTILITLPFVVGGIVLAPRIIDFIYDPTFLPSVLTFQILVIMAGMIYLNNTLSQVLIVANQQKKIFWITFSAAFLNIILNLILIPRFSLYGAAFATLLTFIFIFLLFLKATFKSLAINLFNRQFFFIFLVSCLASFLMYLTISQPQIYHLNVLFSVAIGAIIYAVTFLILKTVLKYFNPYQ